MVKITIFGFKYQDKNKLGINFTRKLFIEFQKEYYEVGIFNILDSVKNKVKLDNIFPPNIKISDFYHDVQPNQFIQNYINILKADLNKRINEIKANPKKFITSSNILIREIGKGLLINNSIEYEFLL